MPKVAVAWEHIIFRPPCSWLTVKKAAASTTSVDLTRLERCVYVIRFSHTYAVQYRHRASPTIYIGRGHFRQRITAHLQWLSNLSEKMSDLEIQVWFFAPRVKRTGNAYKTVEADLIEAFVRENGSVPWFNTSRPNPVYSYTYEPLLRFRHAVLQGRGSAYPWSIRPNSSDEMTELFYENFEAEPRNA